MKFRKKPVEIEAINASVIFEIRDKAGEYWKGGVPSWFKDAYEKGVIGFNEDSISISTLEGEMKAQKDDWIIRGIRGELYPCKSDIFEATYDKVGE